MIRSLFSMASVLCFAGCLTQHGPSLSTNKGGLKLIAVSEDLLAKAAGEDSSVFELGDAKGSFQQYFLLQNTGDEKITNIRLVSDNPALTFSPATLAALEPSKGLSLLQVVKLNIVHGRRLDAEGWSGMLPPGPLEAAITVTGDLPADAETRLDARVRMNVLVMDAEIYDEGLAIGFATPNLYVLGGSIFPVAQAIPVYTPSGDASILNTGNVPIRIRRWKSSAVFDSVLVAPGASWAPEVESFQGGLTGLELAADGVVSDPFKFRKIPDGRFFFRVTRPIP